MGGGSAETLLIAVTTSDNAMTTNVNAELYPTTATATSTPTTTRTATTTTPAMQRQPTPSTSTEPEHADKNDNCHLLYESAKVYQEISKSKQSTRPCGRLSLVRQGDGAINFRWQALSTAKNSAHDYALDFSVSEIYSFKRKNNRLIVVLLSATGEPSTYLPPFIFESGTAVKTFLAHLQVNLASLSGTGNSPTLKHVLDDFNMFVVELPKNTITQQLRDFKIHDNKVVNEVKWTFLEGASTVTRFVRQVQEVVTNGFVHEVLQSPSLSDSFVQMQSLNDVTPVNQTQDSSTLGSESSPADGPVEAFDVVESVLPRKLPTSTREAPITSSEWGEYFLDCGCLKPGKTTLELRRRIFKGGFEPDVRKQGWMFLFGVLPVRSENSDAFWCAKIDEYSAMKIQWDSVTPTQMAYNAAFRDRIERVAKDVARTDRDTDYFGENGSHLDSLGNILCTWCMYNFDLGYVQGMSDMAAVILSIVDDEVTAFWCFVGLMDTEHGAQKNFAENQLGMKQNLQDLQVLVKFYDPMLYQKLDENGSSNMFFAFRWLIVFLKREFSVPDTIKLWDSVWSNYISSKFYIFVCLGMIEAHREKIINFEFDELLQYFNTLAGTFDVDKVVCDAESLCKDIARRKKIPDAVKDLFDVESWPELKAYEERQPTPQQQQQQHQPQQQQQQPQQQQDVGGNNNDLIKEDSDMMNDSTLIANDDDDNNNTTTNNNDHNDNTDSRRSLAGTIVVDPHDERDGSWIDVGRVGHANEFA